MPDATPALPERTLRRYVDERTQVTCLRNTLGLTAYLAEPDQWARGLAAKALELFLERVPSGHLQRFTTSTMTQWQRVDEGDLGSIVEGAKIDGLRGGPRHLFRLRLVNDYGCPSLGFSYTEVDPARAERSGVLEITLPQAGDPAELFQLAMELIHLGPLHSIVGGYALRWNELKEALAFDQAYKWASRYVGLDIQKEHEMAWRTPAALPGTNWLTFLGEPLATARKLNLAELAQAPFEHGVVAMRSDAGVLFRAGESPLLGDLNRFSYPHTYAEVATRTAEALTDVPPPLWGPFHQRRHTTIWHRRFLEPEAWAERGVDFFEQQASPKPA